jgi:anti-sigma B factor antagonist
MKFTTTRHGTATVIGLDGNLMGGADATALHGKLHELVAQGVTRVVVDLAGVGFINSSGLGLLIGGVTAMRNAGGGLKIANASPKIAAVIAITKLGPVLELFPSIDAAVASFDA